MLGGWPWGCQLQGSPLWPILSSSTSLMGALQIPQVFHFGILLQKGKHDSIPPSQAIILQQMSTNSAPCPWMLPGLTHRNNYYYYKFIIFCYLPSAVFIALLLVGPSKCLKQMFKSNLTGLRIPAGRRQIQLAIILQTWRRIWTRDYREQMQLAVRAGLELGSSALTSRLRCPLRGGSRGRVRGVHTPPWDDLWFFNTTGILQKKTMWFIGVEVEQETSAPPPKKNPGSAPAPEWPLIIANVQSSLCYGSFKNLFSRKFWGSLIFGV